MATISTTPTRAVAVMQRSQVLETAARHRAGATLGAPPLLGRKADASVIAEPGPAA